MKKRFILTMTVMVLSTSAYARFGAYWLDNGNLWLSAKGSLCGSVTLKRKADAPMLKSFEQLFIRAQLWRNDMAIDKTLGTINAAVLPGTFKFDWGKTFYSNSHYELSCSVKQLDPGTGYTSERPVDCRIYIEFSPGSDTIPYERPCSGAASPSGVYQPFNMNEA